MWLLDRFGRREVARLGAVAAERWRRQADGWTLIGRHAFSGRPAPDDISAALCELFGRRELNAAPKGGAPAPIDMVVETALVPGMLVHASGILSSPAQVEALLRHRLGQFHARADKPAAADWQVRLDYRAGDAQGLGFGMSPSLKAALDDAQRVTGRKWASIEPASAWLGRTLARRRGDAGFEGWRVCCEQDRALVAFVRRGRVVALNPAAELPADIDGARRLIGIEMLRLGVGVNDAPIVVMTWQARSTESIGTVVGPTWCSLASPLGNPKPTRSKTTAEGAPA